MIDLNLKNPNLSTSLIKSFMVIELLSEFQELTLTELSKRLELNKSSIHRILSTLIELGYVNQNPLNRKYRLSSKLFEIGSQSKGLRTLDEAAVPVMESLSRETLETINLAILDKGEVVYLKKIESQQPLRMDMPVGTRLPPNCTSLGKSLIAHLPDRELKKLFAGKTIQKMTSRSITDLRKLKTELASVRELGYAVDNEEFSDGIRCVSAPIWGAEHEVVGALSIAGPSLRFKEHEIKKYARVVIQGAQEIARRLNDASP